MEHFIFRLLHRLWHIKTAAPPFSIFILKKSAKLPMI